VAPSGVAATSAVAETSSVPTTNPKAALEAGTTTSDERKGP